MHADTKRREYEELTDPRLFDAWAGVLGWLYDETRFGEGWTSGRLSWFTKRAKALAGEENWATGKIFEDSSPGKAAVWMRAGGGKDLIRHIRNGIAHGEYTVTKREDGLWIFIRDYDGDKKPAAQIRLPLEYIIRLHKVYKDMERGWV